MGFNSGFKGLNVFNRIDVKNLKIRNKLKAVL